MSNPRFNALVLSAALLAMAACSSTSSRSAASDDTTATSSSLAGATTTLVGGTTTSLATSTSTAAAPAPTAAPTNPPATNPPATNPPATNPPATNPPSAGPKVVSATFNGPSACPSPDVSVPLPPQTVSISWSATNADSVYVAIDNPYGPWQQNLPLIGSISDLPFGCPGSHTYYVVAVKGPQTDIKQKTFTAN